MKQETLEVYGYRKVDEAVRRIEVALPPSILPVLGYSADALVTRLAQKITMEITLPFLREGIRRYVGGEPSFPSDDGAFTCGEIAVDMKTGRARPEATLVLRSSAAFLMLWLAHLGGWLLSFVKGRGRVPAVLLYGVPEADLSYAGNDARFMKFCRHGPLAPLRDAKRLVIQTARRVIATRAEEVSYVRLPLLATLSSQRLGMRDSGYFLTQHISALVAFCMGLVRTRIHCLLWRDLAEHAAAAALDRAGLVQAVVITNTNWQQQFLWMNALPNRRFRSYLALYSLNNHVIVYKSDPVNSAHPALPHLKVDEVWAWNEPYRDLLAREGVTVPSVALEPILWYLPEPSVAHPAETVPTLCVFDVAPRTTASAQALGALVNYYNLETATRFIDDIVRAREDVRGRTGVELRIVLKHKRPPLAMHDSAYFDHVERLRATVASFELVDTDSNVYTLIGASRIVIVPPYSSPAYVAAHMGIPALFYDASREVLPTHAPHPLIRFVGNPGALAEAIAEIVAQPAERAAVERVTR